MEIQDQNTSTNQQEVGTTQKVQNVVKHKIVKKCPKKYRWGFFWFAFLVAVSFLVASSSMGMIRITIVAAVWIVCFFFLIRFAYKNYYTRVSMLPLFFATVAISFAAVMIKTEEDNPAPEQREEKAIQETKEKKDPSTQIAQEISKVAPVAFLKKIQSQNASIPFGEIEDQEFAEWHGKDGNSLVRGGVSFNAENVSEEGLYSIEQFLSQEGFKPNKNNEGVLTGAIGYKGFDSEELACIIATDHYVNESKKTTKIKLTCFDLEQEN